MKSLVNQLVNLVNYIARSRTARELRYMTDSRLTDLGLSRFKLEQGAAGYPWKLEVSNSAVVLNFAEVTKKPAPVNVPEVDQAQDQVAA